MNLSYPPIHPSISHFQLVSVQLTAHLSQLSCSEHHSWSVIWQCNSGEALEADWSQKHKWPAESESSQLLYLSLLVSSAIYTEVWQECPSENSALMLLNFNSGLVTLTRLVTWKTDSNKNLWDVLPHHCLLKLAQDGSWPRVHSYK